MGKYRILITALVILIGCNTNNERTHQSEVEKKFNHVLKDGEYYTGTIYNEWDNGNLEFEAEIKEGQPHGVVRYFYDDGSPESIAHYIKGKRHGAYRYYWKIGLKIETTYENDLEHGIHREYKPNGEIWAIIEFENGSVKVIQTIDDNFNHSSKNRIRSYDSGWVKFHKPNSTIVEYIYAERGDIEGSPYMKFEDYRFGLHTKGEYKVNRLVISLEQASGVNSDIY